MNLSFAKDKAAWCEAVEGLRKTGEPMTEESLKEAYDKAVKAKGGKKVVEETTEKTTEDAPKKEKKASKKK